MSASAGIALNPNMVHHPGRMHNRVDMQSSEPIMIYLSTWGSLIPIRVLESDSIASVKLRIQQTCNNKGSLMKKQKLVFGGRELARNNSLVKDYGVSGGNVLHLVLKLSDLLAITVSTTCGKEFELQMDRYRNVAYLKQVIFREGKGFVDLEDQDLFCNGEKLDDGRLIDDITKNGDGVIHLLVKTSAKVRTTPVENEVELSVVACEKKRKKSKKSGDSRDFLLEPITVNPNIRLPLVIKDLISKTIDGLEKRNKPVRSTEGTGGTYFMRNGSGDEVVSVFKPIDEEPQAVNNPQGLPVSESGEGLKKGTRVGEGALREVAAYLLDHPQSGPRSVCGEVMGFSGVPPTTMVRCLHSGFNHPGGFECASENVKIGSLQMFKKNDGNCEDIAANDFPVEEVHKISVLDIRLANADRHAGNILYRKDAKHGGYIELIPIDHGYCLPDSFEDCTFDWLYWPQAQKPYSTGTIEYIKALDAEQDLALLRSHGWDVPIECARVLRIATMLLKKGVEKGMTPFSIGSIMCRPNVNTKSMIEEIILQAWDSLLIPGTSEEHFLKRVSQLMDIRLDD